MERLVGAMYAGVLLRAFCLCSMPCEASGRFAGGIELLGDQGGSGSDSYSQNRDTLCLCMTSCEPRALAIPPAEFSSDWFIS